MNNTVNGITGNGTRVAMGASYASIAAKYGTTISKTFLSGADNMAEQDGNIATIGNAMISRAVEVAGNIFRNVTNNRGR